MKILIPFFMSLILLAGCQKAPEAANDDEILRAKGNVENTVEDIVGEETETSSKGKEAGNSEMVDLVIGDGENRMKIEAEIKAVPETVNILTAQADSRLNEETLREFLEPQGTVEDITQKMLDEMTAEEERVRKIDEELGQESSIVQTATIGDDSYIALTDGNRKAIFSGKVHVTYEDAQLKDKYLTIVQQDAQELDVKDPKAGQAAFSLQDAKEVLLKKCSPLGIEDVFFNRAYYYEKDGFIGYEVWFVPVMDGINVAYSFAQADIERIYPNGFAWISTEGIASLNLYEFCMEQVSAKEEGKVISWDKLQQVLKTYVDNGSLQCREWAPFTTVELVYYPELKGDKAKFVPIWNLHMELGDHIDYCVEHNEETVWNIYIDGMTGELVEVE